VSWRRHAVALFVAFHATSVVLMSLPHVPDTADPQVEVFVADAGALLGPWAENPARRLATAYGAVVGEGAGRVPAVRAAHRRPAGLDHVRRRADRGSSGFEVWADRGAGWAPLYVAGSDEATWRRRFFENERVRTFVHGLAKGKKARTGQLADWVYRAAVADDPAIRSVRVRFVRLTIPPHEELARTGVLREGDPFRTEVRPRKGAR
jgi:hypothetical protein